MEIKTKKLIDNAKLPLFQTEFSAGADLYSAESAIVEPNKTYFFSTGIAVEIPLGFAGFVFARSGLSTKQGLAPANKVGVIDSDYRGEIKVALYNHSSQARQINVGDRIAQLVIMPVATAQFVEVDKLNDSDRGEGGFGSTGIK